MGSALGADYLFPWQRSFIAEVVYGPNKYIILEKSRRIGGTWSVAIAAVDYCMRTGHNCWFSSSDETNAKEFIVYVKQYAEVWNAIAGGAVIDCEQATVETVYLPNGAKISGLSSNSRALRGKDGLMVWDEAALHDRQEEFYRALQPCVMQRGKILILSTHNGPVTLYNRLATEAAKGKRQWAHYKVPLSLAVAQGYARKFGDGVSDAEYIANIRASCLSPDAYGQEYECEPLALTSLVSADAYDRCALAGPEWAVADTLLPDTIDEDLTVQRRYGNLYCGIDVGRVHDLTVCWVAEQFRNPHALNLWDQYDYKTVCVVALRNTPFPLQYQRLRPILAHPNMQKVLIDRGSVGRALADAFGDEFSDRCEPFDFHPTHKAEVAERLKGYIDLQRISLPPAPHGARDDFLCVRREAGPTGNLRYEGSTKDTHADHFWAAGLCVTAADVDTGAIIVGG